MRSVLAAILVPATIGATMVLVRHAASWGTPFGGLTHQHAHRDSPQPLRVEIRAPSVSVKLAATLVTGFTGIRIDVDQRITGTMAFQMSEQRDKRMIAEAFLSDLRAQGFEVVAQGEGFLVRPPS